MFFHSQRFSRSHAIYAALLFAFSILFLLFWLKRCKKATPSGPLVHYRIQIRLINGDDNTPVAGERVLLSVYDMPGEEHIIDLSKKSTKHIGFISDENGLCTAEFTWPGPGSFTKYGWDVLPGKYYRYTTNGDRARSGYFTPSLPAPTMQLVPESQASGQQILAPWVIPEICETKLYLRPAPEEELLTIDPSTGEKRLLAPAPFFDGEKKMLTLPDVDKEYGFDFCQNDLVAPYGKGEVAHVLFRYHFSMPEKGVNHMELEIKPALSSGWIARSFTQEEAGRHPELLRYADLSLERLPSVVCWKETYDEKVWGDKWRFPKWELGPWLQLMVPVLGSDNEIEEHYALLRVGALGEYEAPWCPLLAFQYRFNPMAGSLRIDRAYDPTEMEYGKVLKFWTNFFPELKTKFPPDFY